ncbi:MAG: hypothetical protein ACKVPX_12850 [Myxococcaceae bacterium]
MSAARAIPSGKAATPASIDPANLAEELVSAALRTLCDHQAVVQAAKTNFGEHLKVLKKPKFDQKSARGFLEGNVPVWSCEVLPLADLKRLNATIFLPDTDVTIPHSVSGRNKDLPREIRSEMLAILRGIERELGSWEIRGWVVSPKKVRVSFGIPKKTHREVVLRRGMEIDSKSPSGRRFEPRQPEREFAIGQVPPRNEAKWQELQTKGLYFRRLVQCYREFTEYCEQHGHDRNNFTPELLAAYQSHRGRQDNYTYLMFKFVKDSGPPDEWDFNAARASQAEANARARKPSAPSVVV